MATKRDSMRATARPYGPRGDPRARFLKFVDPTPTDRGCRLWTGTAKSLKSGGHGSFWFGDTMVGAHRVAWLLERGEVPDGLEVLHRCDNPICVNTEHLFLGTQGDNIADMVAKGRQQRRAGEANHEAKLTLEQVGEIRACYAEGGVTFAALGGRFGVCEATISHIVNGRTWKSAA